MSTSKRHIANKHTPAEIEAIIASSTTSKEEGVERWWNENRPAQYKRAVLNYLSNHKAGTAESASSERAARAPRGAFYAPPKVIRGEMVPDRVVVQEGRAVIEPARRGWGGDAAFCDWINFTVDESSFYWNEGKDELSVGQLIYEISYRCYQWFGFGIVEERKSGANFYERSWKLGEQGGMVCLGGQKNTVLFSLPGKALANALPGWERRIYEFLEHMAVRPRISRFDAAFDDLDGSRYSVDQANADFDAGYFRAGGNAVDKTRKGGRMPECAQLGDWKNPRGKGRTFCVGSRKNGKYVRVYEKGMQLGDKESLWCRVEVEFKSVDQIIPFDILLKAGEYLAASYPAFNWIKEKQCKITREKKAREITYESVIKWLKRQCGPSLWFAAEVEGGAEALFAKIMRRGVVPKRLNVFDTATMAQLNYSS